MLKFYIPMGLKKRMCITIDMAQFLAAFFIFVLTISALCYTMTLKGKAETTQKYETVYVEKGDTIWSIARRYAGEKQDVRELVTEIQEINKVQGNIYPAQRLKIPLE